jgi:hypothetical protein
MPWLVLHPLLPVILLAGLGLQSLLHDSRRVGSRALLALAAVGAAVAVRSAVEVAYLHPASPRELLVQVQTSDDVPAIRSELVGLDETARRRSGHPLSIWVDSWGGTGWPWSWYLRGDVSGYADLSEEVPPPDAQAVLVAEPNVARIKPVLHGYVARRFRLRVWWVQDWGAAGVRDWVDWLVFRKPWGSTATMDEVLYVRRDVARSFGHAGGERAS